MPRKRLSPSMTIQEFDHGYWYATELKGYARAIGIRGASALRKDQLESAVRSVLSGQRASIVAAAPPSVVKDAARDTARPLTMTRRIVRYTNDRATKDFLQR